MSRHKNTLFSLMLVPATLCCASPVTLDHPLASNTPATPVTGTTASAMAGGHTYLRPAAITMETLGLALEGSMAMGAASCTDTLTLFAMGLRTAARMDATITGAPEAAAAGWWQLNPALPFTGEPSSLMEFETTAFDPQILGGNRFTAGGDTVMGRQFRP